MFRIKGERNIHGTTVTTSESGEWKYAYLRSFLHSCRSSGLFLLSKFDELIFAIEAAKQLTHDNSGLGDARRDLQPG